MPNCRAWDPCFGYELAVIIQDGIRRMLEAGEDVFYYLTVMNENYVQPVMPVEAEAGILRGMYRVRGDGAGEAQLLGSGAILRECLAAAELLGARPWGARRRLSVTSWTELRCDGRDADAAGRASWVEACLGATRGPVVAVSDYVSALADLIRPWVPGKMVSLGTDGFGRSDTRSALREYFGVSAQHIARAALAAISTRRQGS